jgi:hypothetical protein
MNLFSTYCKQWADQYLELAEQRSRIDAAMKALETLILSNGGAIPVAGQQAAKPMAVPEPEAPVPAVPQKSTRKLPPYDSRGSWAYKIEYILAGLTDHDDPMPVLDIALAITGHEPGLETERVIKAVTMEASKMGLNGKLGIKKKGNKNFYFLPKQLGLPLGE